MRDLEPILIANPLPAALSHYVVEMSETLQRANIPCSAFRTLNVEGEIGYVGKLKMLSSAIVNGLRGRTCETATILVWPSLGYIDARLWSNKRTSNFVIIHDPIPIRKQFGYGDFSKSFARGAGKNAPKIIVHSSDALHLVEQFLPKHNHLLLPHPLTTKQRRLQNPIFSNPTVVVAGQFKPERNVKLLADLGPLLKSIGVDGRIYGRGWPSVPGWTVDDRFLSETEMDSVLSSASVVLIPYRRYYQSGVAVRALELGTMSLSPPNSFAREVLGRDGIVEEDSASSWIASIELLINDLEVADSAFVRYQNHVDSTWSAVLGY